MNSNFGWCNADPRISLVTLAAELNNRSLTIPRHFQFPSSHFITSLFLSCVVYTASPLSGSKHPQFPLPPNRTDLGLLFSCMSLSSLPFELRSLIWSLAVAPRRIINMRAKKSNGKFTKKQRQKGKDILYETTSTSPPALMHVCRESRQQAPYQRAFTAGTEPRWTWVNFELDIFCVSSLYAIEDIVSHRSEVQQLQIRTDDHPDWYESATRYNGLSGLDKLDSLGEIQVVLEPGDLMWGDVFADQNFGCCPKDNITFLDEGSGLVLTGSQLKMVGDWRIVFSFDSEGNPPDPDRLSEEINHALDDFWHMTLAQMQELN